MRTVISIQQGVARHPLRRMAEPVSLAIMEGEQIAIVGSNAAGKSRLVDFIIGRYPLLQNDVHYDFGENAHSLVCDNLKYIAFRDSYGDSEGNTYYQQRWNQHDIDENTPRVATILEQSFRALPHPDAAFRDRLYRMFHLEGLLDKYVISLSSGELRKLQLAKALMGAPHMLVMDNPFIGLDAPTRQLLSQLLAELIQQMALTVVLILSKTDDLPAFITHVIPVEGMVVKEKMAASAYRPVPCPQPALPVETEQQIALLPSKDLSTISFYPPNGGEVLKFNSISVRYGRRTILKDLSWTVREGERWALSGENGAGKSTLLSLVCADNPQAYACNIELFGHRRGSGESIWEIKRHIGYVSPEMHRTYRKDLPAIDIVASGLSDSVGLYFRPRPEQRETCLFWMRVFGIDQLANRNYLQLSSGEQRLCLLARAFVKDPELLILDEPMHGLDLSNCARVKAVINTFCQRPNKTLVMVTHYQEELPNCITHHLRLCKVEEDKNETETKQ